MITSRDIARLAESTGFRVEVVEKVLRLRSILERLDLAPDLLSRPAFRLAFVASIAACRADARSLQVPSFQLDRQIVARELEPMLRSSPDGPIRSCDQLIAWIEPKLHPATECLLAWSDAERRFLDPLLNDGVIESENLHLDPEVQDRVRKQPMLQRKAKNVRAYRHRET